MTRLHQWDVLRANKAPFAFGLETRVPFLDKQFLQVAMSIDAAHKMPNLGSRPDGVHPKLEKYILRKAFDDPDQPYLPDEVLFRQKEQFSDGVGYDWVDGLKEYAAKVKRSHDRSNLGIEARLACLSGIDFACVALKTHSHPH